MKILIACEYSGIVREEFALLGHDVWSCDILPTEQPGQHYQGNVLDILYDEWDMMIGFPPCTYLTYAATGYWDRPGRIKKRLEALEFFRKLWEAPIEKICLENPLGIASTVITKHHQVVEPYFFGDQARKRTCLWLKNLPKLVHIKQGDLFLPATHIEPPSPKYIDNSGKKRYSTDAISGNNNGGHKRSRFWKGIANAMAEQWTTGDFIKNCA
jgi:hypothetical protein